MGKQVQLHMLDQDMKMFLDFVQQNDQVVVTLKSCDSPGVTPVPNAATHSEVMTLWNKTLLPSLQRKLIHRSEGHDYYRVDDSLPTLDLSPSRLIEWTGRPALLQGRIYGLFDEASPCYEDWFHALAKWIRRNYQKCPVKLLGGYIGPAALRWFEGGGVLLPMFEPPQTSEWLSVVEKQHRGLTEG